MTMEIASLLAGFVTSVAKDSLHLWKVADGQHNPVFKLAHNPNVVMGLDF